MCYILQQVQRTEEVNQTALSGVWVLSLALGAD